MATMTAADGAIGRGWLAVAERGSVLGIRILVGLALTAGRAPTRMVLRVVAGYYLVADATLRRVSRRYLERIYHRVTWWKIYGHILRFAEVALDRVFIATGKYRGFAVTRTGYQHLENLQKSRRGALLLGAHVGSFEAMRMQGDREDFQIHFVGQFGNARMINAALAKLNIQSRARLIAKEDGVDFMLRIRDTLQKGDSVAILADRVGPGERTCEVEFLGGQASFPTGPYRLASLLRCPVYLTFGLYRRPNRYDFFCEPFEDEICLSESNRDQALQAYAQKFACRLEHYVRQAPDNWFNFYEFWQSS